MIEQLVTAIAAGGFTGAGAVLLLREWLSERLKQSINAEYARTLENHKKELELLFADQVRLRKLYEELVMSLEDVFGRMKDQTPAELSMSLHKMFALLALYAPDEVYRKVKDVFYINGTKTVFAKDVRPIIHSVLRKSLLGDQTALRAEDLVDNIEVNPLVEKT